MIDPSGPAYKLPTMSSLRRSLVAVASATILGGILGVAGCEDQPRTTTTRRIEDPWAVAQGAGLLPLIVRGRPAFASDEAVDEAVFRAATQAITWTATPALVRATPGDERAAMRLVYVFNGDGGDACAGAPIAGEPLPKGRVTLVAALCDGAQFVARVDGRLRRSEGVEDQRLRRLIRQATRDLLAPPPAPRP
jgi:hypothetical protein